MPGMTIPFKVSQPAQPTTSVSTPKDPLDTRLPYKPFTSWAPLPDDDVPPLAVELVGDFATGKTHCAATFPTPALCDTELKGWMVWRKFKNPYYYRAKDWGDVLAFFEHCIDDDEIKTLVFDSSKDVRDYAEQWTLGETGKKSLVYKAPSGKMATGGFSMVYRKLDALVHEARTVKKNIVFTSRIKPEYVDEVQTGRTIRDGYNKAPYQFDVVLRLRPGVDLYSGRVLYGKRIFAEVMKVGWLHYSHWPPYLMDVSYDGIVNELIKGSWDASLKTPDEFIEERVKPLMVQLGVRE